MELYLARSAETSSRLEAILTWTHGNSLLCPQLRWESCCSYNKKCLYCRVHTQTYLAAMWACNYLYLAVLIWEPHHQLTCGLGQYGCKNCV